MRPVPLPDVSIVLCTSGRRAPALARCLQSLSRLRGVSTELIVVENRRRQMLQPVLVPRVPTRFVHEPRRGLDVARNRGAAEAKAPIVAFIDDDCEASPDWLKHIVAAFADPAVACVTGRVLPANIALETAKWFEARFSFDRGEQSRCFRRGDHLPWFPTHPYQLGTGCNMAVRRDVLHQVGGFDPALDMGTFVGGGGDLDLFRRVLLAGHTAAYAPTAVIRHHHRADRAALGYQFFGYGATVTALATKSILTGDGGRWQSAKFVKFYFSNELQQVRARLRGSAHVTVPVRMLACEMAGHLWGPVGYLLGVAHPNRRRRGRFRRP